MTNITATTTWDAVVIGGGAAGLSAAQSLGRSLRRTLVIDAGSPRNRFASHMHNVLGLDGTPPAQLLARGREEAERYGVTFREGSVRAVRDGSAPEGEPGSGSPSTVQIELVGGETIDARALLVATGLRDALPPIPGLAEHWGSGVLHCPYCHGWEVRGRRLAVMTTSPLGLHQAKLLRQWTDDLVVFSAGSGALDAETERAFTARDVAIEPDPVAEIVGDGSRVTSVRTESGREVAVDAVFTASEMVPHDDFLAELALERAESPMGGFLAVDAMSRTSHPRVWAAGNVVNPWASVPMVMGAGAFAGAAVNAALVEEDFARAADEPAERAHRHGAGHGAAADEDPDEDPVAFWQRRYAGSDPVWSGRANRTLIDIASDWAPGRSLDLGCGEGGDVLWLAERGWEAAGTDLSEAAVARARGAAAERGVANARFAAVDLGVWAEDPASVPEAAGHFDLVTASFLQSPVELPRERILRAASERVAPGGRLVVISHAAPPPWAEGQHGPGDFPTPETELALLGLDPERWAVTAEVRTREATGPGGETSALDDTLVVAQRIR